MARFPNTTRNDLNWPRPLIVRSSRKILVRALMIGCLFTSGLVVPQESFALGFTYHSEVSPRPSKLTGNIPFKVYWYYRCVSALDGRPLDCPLTHKVTGLKDPPSEPDNNAGHVHSSGRPFVLAGTKLEYPQDSDPDDLAVSGSSLAGGGVPFVLHTMPEASGTFEVEGILSSPPGWFCVSGCYTLTSHRFLTAYKVAIRDSLIELPAADNVYIRCARTAGCTTDSPSDSLHDSVFFGKPNLVYSLIGLGAMYRSQTGELLRITDMNLFKGGVLDINGNWTAPHKSHRTGNDADISRYALANNLTELTDQDVLNVMIKRIELRRHREVSPTECPVFQEGEPPCIHISVP